MIGVYVSAGWCPPCRAFSPILSNWAKERKKDFDVVFVSLDKRFVSSSPRPTPSRVWLSSYLVLRKFCTYGGWSTYISMSHLFFLSVKLIVFCDGFSTPRPPSPNKAVNQRTSTSKDARLDILANRPSRIRFTCGKPYPLKTSECSVPCALRAEQRARDAQLRRWKGLLAAAFRTGIHQAQSSRIVRCPSLAHPHHC